MFSRLMPAMVTPLDEGGEVDLGAAEAVVERFVEARVSGISPLGSTGEAPVSFRTSPAKSASASPRG
jgi:dihydrodipicolinate synthase/N-acetylneuraminate lyase